MNAASAAERGSRAASTVRRSLSSAGFVPGPHGLDSLIVGVYEKKRLTFVAKVRIGFVPRIRDEIFPQLKKRIIDDCPFTNLPEKASRWGEALTAEKMKECRWGRAGAGLPGRLRRVDRRWQTAALHFRRHEGRQSSAKDSARDVTTWPRRRQSRF